MISIEASYNVVKIKVEVKLMLKLEEYIARRKAEDKLNEFDLNTKDDNLKICVNYMFEYFNQYLDPAQLNEKTILANEKIDKYRKQLDKFETEIQEWLVQIYEGYDRQIHKSINHLLKKNELFYLFHTESEFRSFSYDCYAQLIKKNHFLKDYPEELFKYIKEFHLINSSELKEWQNPAISEDIDKWIENTWVKYHVSIWAFVDHYITRFSENEEMWPVKHKVKLQGVPFNSYDYKQKSNLFNLNSLYPKISYKPFIKGKKQFLEILMMHTWLHSIERDSTDYWQEYFKKVIKN